MAEAEEDDIVKEGDEIDEFDGDDADNDKDAGAGAGTAADADPDADPDPDAAAAAAAADDDDDDDDNEEEDDAGSSKYGLENGANTDFKPSSRVMITYASFAYIYTGVSIDETDVSDRNIN